MSLEGTTTLPAVGKVKTSYVAIGAAGVAGLVGFAWYRRSQSMSDTGTGNLYADTRTGSNLPSDTAADSGSIDTTDGDGGGWKAPRTDQEWTQQVIEKLSWYEPGFVSSACGKYLAGQVLTADEQNVIREAWAQVGRPPGGQQIRTTPTGPTGPSNPGPLPPDPGRPTGEPSQAPRPVAGPPTGVRASQVARTSVLMAWGPPASPHPQIIGYRLYQNGAFRLKTLPGSPATLPGLRPNTTYRVGVAVVYQGWKVGPQSTITVRTAK